MFGKTISSSFHELKDLEDCYFEFDYHLLTPEFSSTSKKYQNGRNFSVTYIDKIIINMGGISAENMEALDTLSYTCIGVLGGV